MKGDLQAMMTRRQFTVCLATATGLMATLARPSASLAGAGDGFRFVFDGFDGKPLPLSRFRGRAVLVVNTASKCGYTGQYAGLEKLWQEFGPRGLTIVGVPSNDFGSQEPLQGEAIKNFCSLNFGVTFPLADRTPVTGDAAHPFYKWARETAGDGAIPKWNFHKILLGPDGAVAATFPSPVTPDAAVLQNAITAALPRS
jgi:glutathione peroxidase